MTPEQAAVEDLRALALDASASLALMLASGGDAFGGAWVGLTTAAIDARKKPVDQALLDLVRALDAAWRQPPDAFPDEAAAIAWAMALRPRIRAALDAAPVPARPARVPKGRGVTRNGRKLLDALDPNVSLPRSDLARRTGLWRGAVNRSLERLFRDGLAIEGPDGVRRA